MFVGLRLLREYNANAMQLSVVVVVFFFLGKENVLSV